MNAQTMSAELQQAQTTILKATEITPDQYSELMFRYGSEFARHFSRKFLNRHDVYKSLTQNRDFGYWDWFKTKWQMDDAALVKMDCINGCLGDRSGVSGEASYEEMKACMIGDCLLEKQLFHETAHLL